MNPENASALLSKMITPTEVASNSGLEVSSSDSISWFVLRCALFFAPLAVLLAAAAISLSIVGELITPQRILALQQSGPVIWDPMYQPKSASPAYKILGARQRRPEVLALGTSRIYSLRHELLRVAGTRFYNGCVFASPLGGIRQFLEQLPSDHLPHAVILDIDPWWFDEHAQVQPPPDYFRPASQMQILNFAWRNGLYLLTQRWAMLAPRNLIGGGSRLRGSGLRADGSWSTKYRSLDTIPNLLETQLSDVRAGTDERFLRGSPGVSSAAVEEMQRLLNYCSAHHMALIGYMSTYHPSLYEALKRDSMQAYIWQIAPVLAPMFQKAGEAFFDLQDPAVAGCQAGEYLDSFHESEVCTARELIVMARGDSRAAAIIDAGKLEGFLSHRRSEWQLALGRW